VVVFLLCFRGAFVRKLLGSASIDWACFGAISWAHLLKYMAVDASPIWWSDAVSRDAWRAVSRRHAEIVFRETGYFIHVGVHEVSASRRSIEHPN